MNRMPVNRTDGMEVLRRSRSAKFEAVVNGKREITREIRRKVVVRM